MTLGSLLHSNFGSYRPIHDRGEHIYHGPWKGGSSKGGSKGSQSALSALTLLAFLFFLNILQSCLKDQLASQSPITIMMTTTTTTTTTEAQRHKRDLEDENRRSKGDTAKIAPKKELEGSKETYYQNETLTNYETLYFTSINEFDSRYKILAKTKNNLIKTISIQEENKVFKLSPWLQAVICCKILSCQEGENSTNQTINSQYSSFFRKMINRVCQ